MGDVGFGKAQHGDGADVTDGDGNPDAEEYLKGPVGGDSNRTHNRGFHCYGDGRDYPTADCCHRRYHELCCRRLSFDQTGVHWNQHR